MPMLPELLAAVRRLRRSPAFAALSVAILALGIGAVTAMYTVVHQVVLRPLPVREQERLVVAWTDHRVRNVSHYPLSGPIFEAVDRSGLPAFEGVAAVGAWGTREGVVEEPDGPVTLLWAHTLGDFFGVLGVRPVAGRTLRTEDDVPAPAERVAVISEALWASRYGRSPEAIGSVLRARRGGEVWTHTVVGVLPADFDHPRGAQVWTPTRPLYPTWGEEAPHLELDLVARLAPGASPDQAAAQIEALLDSTPEFARTHGDAEPVVLPFADVVLGDLKPTLLLLLGGAALVLLVAALDVTGLVLIRAVGRRRAVAVRCALGAGPRQLLKEAASEAVVLGAAAAAVGAGLAWVAVRALVPLAPAGLPRLDQVQGLDATSYLLAVAGSSVVVLGAVLVPLRRSGWRNPAEGLRPGARGSGSAPGGAARVRSVLVSGQVALAVWVLGMGLLTTRTVVELRRLDPGFRADELTAVALDHDAGAAGRAGWPDRLRAATEEIERAPGIRGATPLQMAPLPGNAAWQTIVYKEGQTPEEARDRNPFLLWELVAPNAFEVLGVPVLRGRGIRGSDREGAPRVVVVNEAAARAYWPRQEALGRSIRAPFSGEDGVHWTVVGVVADTRYGDLTERRPSIFFPIHQMPRFPSRFLLVRTAGTAPPVMRLARDALARHAPDFRPKSAVAVRSRLDEPLVRPRFAALLLAVFSGVAILLAGGGVYGIMAFLVQSRRREIGVRLACGATPRAVGALVLRRGLAVALVGAAVGAAGAVASGALFESLLYGVEPSDPTSLAGAVVVAVLAATAACWVPARRAADVDPAVVLRGE